MGRPMRAPSGPATGAYSLRHITGYTTKDKLCGRSHHLSSGKRADASASNPGPSSLRWPCRRAACRGWRGSWPWALRLEAQLRRGVLKDCAEVARLGHVTRARVSQILTLVHLAPDIQEAILSLPRTQRGRDPVILSDLMPIAMELDWKRQRRAWRRLVGTV